MKLLKTLFVVCTILICSICISNFNSVSNAAGTDGISMRSITAYATKNSDWLKSDKMGQYILSLWLFDMGTINDMLHNYETITVKTSCGKERVPVRVEKERTGYFMKNEYLRVGNSREGFPGGIKQILAKEFDKMRNNTDKKINLQFHAVMENGEQIIGYQYLHGTNADVGDFQITGTASKNLKGNVDAKLHFVWNDIIDPNFQYSTDSQKAKIAKQIPGSHIQNFVFRLYWDQRVIYNKIEPVWHEFLTPKTSWPFVKW